jgi:N-acetylglucosaminyl-diphospho-decaprenol L-rhamnosyltransferase
VSGTSVVVVSHDSAGSLERCLEGVVGCGYEVVVVDSASTDRSPDLVRRRFPDVRLIELERNLGYGGANNVGIQATTGEYVLVLNPDAWPLGKAIERLVEAAEVSPWAGIVGPRLVDETGTQEQSVRGFPTVWRLATEYFFLRWLAPRSRLLNAFYGAGADPERRGEVEWVVGAAMLLRREALDEVQLFDSSFFMYNDEVDLAFRLRRLGWEVLYYPHAEFVHLGGGSTQQRPFAMYREQLRSHLRFLDKHYGRASAERGRKVLLYAMRVRAVVFRGERRRVSADAASWLRARDVEALLSDDGRQPVRHETAAIP